MILNQPAFFGRDVTLNGAITGTDAQVTLTGLSTRFTDAVAAGTLRYPLGPFRISDADGFELIAITGHVSGDTFTVEREIQGTDALAWADGTAVRAVISKSTLLNNRTDDFSTFFAPDLIYDDFDYPDGPLAGNVTPTGQAWINATVWAEGINRKYYLRQPDSEARELQRVGWSLYNCLLNHPLQQCRLLRDLLSTQISKR